MTNIVLNTKTYSGRGLSNLIASWVNTASGLLAAFAQLTGSVRLPQGKDAKANIQWRLRVPIVATEASSCACPGSLVDEIDAYIQVRVSQGVTDTVRTDFALQLKDLVATPEFQASITSFQQPVA